MSRTYRCKDARQRDPKRYLKSFRWIDDTVYCSGWYFAYPEDPREQFHNWYFTHGESRNANHRSPSKWWREYCENAFKRHNIRELRRYVNNPDYEPMVYENPRSCFNAWWNWM